MAIKTKKNNNPHTLGTKFDILKTKEIHPEQYGKMDRQVMRSITPPGIVRIQDTWEIQLIKIK